MKNEKPDKNAKTDPKKEAQPAENAEKKDLKAEKKAKKAREKAHANAVELPILLEICFSFSGIFLVLVDLVVLWVSYVSGADWIAIFTRLVVTTVVVGLLLWQLTMHLSNGSLEAAVLSQEEEKQKRDEARQEMSTKAVEA